MKIRTYLGWTPALGWAPIVILAVCAVVGFYLLKPHEVPDLGYVAPAPAPGEVELASETYLGELKTASNAYSVKIEEIDRGYGPDRIMHLRPVGADSLVSITGHDYNSDGVWGQVFYCGYRPQIPSGVQAASPEPMGCNSVIQTAAGWVFKPSVGDNGMPPFTQQEIDFAVGELDQALVAVRTPSQLAVKRLWYPAEKQCKVVFAKK